MDQKNRIIVLILFSLMTLSHPKLSKGATWESIPFGRAVQEADLIVEATVSDIHSYFEKGEVSPESGERNLIRSNITLELDGPGSIWKGSERLGTNRQIVLNTIGGQVGDITLINTAMHAFVVGERLVVLLKAISPGEPFKEGAEYKIPSGLMDTFSIAQDGYIQSLRFSEEAPQTRMTRSDRRWKIEDGSAVPKPAQ